MSEIRTAVTNERRRLAARLLAWLKNHPRTVVTIASVVVVVAVTFGLLRG